MKYDDLLNVPYKRLGRDLSGLDCYGLAIECTRRTGKELKDFANISKLQESELNDYICKVNVKEVDSPKFGDLVQCVYDNEIHVGFLLDKITCIHMTNKGAKVTPIIFLKDKKYFEVT